MLKRRPIRSTTVGHPRVTKWTSWNRLGSSLVACAAAMNPDHRLAIGQIAEDLGGAIVRRDVLRAKVALIALVALSDDAPAVKLTAAGAAVLEAAP